MEMDSSLLSEAGDIVQRMDAYALPPNDCFNNRVNLLFLYGIKSLAALPEEFNRRIIMVSTKHLCLSSYTSSGN